MVFVYSRCFGLPLRPVRQLAHTLHYHNDKLTYLARLAPQELEQKLRDYLGGFGFQGDKVTEETRE
ncbi:hypothetical protein AWP60_05515 [Escherichia coli]|nr:hypothetical protein AWP60_05515 [Escherichia coli]